LFLIESWIYLYMLKSGNWLWRLSKSNHPF